MEGPQVLGPRSLVTPSGSASSDHHFLLPSSCLLGAEVGRSSCAWVKPAHWHSGSSATLLQHVALLHLGGCRASGLA